MPETISCPKCDRKLRVPEESLGKLAQCPACQFTFTVERPSNEPRLPPSLPVGVARVEEEEPPPSQPRRGGWFDEVRRKREQREAEQATGGDLNFLDDAGARPHRGTSILMLGVIGIVLSCIPLLGGTLGLIATAMGSSDLQDMARRRMDRSGKGATQTGQWCGVIAIIVNLVVTLYACMGGFRR